MHLHLRTAGAAICLVLLVLVAGCSSDKKSATTTTPARTTVASTVAKSTSSSAKPAKPAKPATTTTTTSSPGFSPGTGGVRGPSFLTFRVMPGAVCTSGNATLTLAYTTKNVVDISIDVGGTGFKETGGYEANESSAVAAAPCKGAGTITVQMKGCSASGACTASAKSTVKISV